MATNNSSLHNISQEEDLAPETEVPLERETNVPLENHHWEQGQEEEWSEHTATAWTLAHIIHRIYSTPLPPTLSPDQRRHFHKIIKMAAALIEEWQQREREQAQHLATERPTPPFEEVQEALEAEVTQPPTPHPTRQ
jgi:hypothetical protein